MYLFIPALPIQHTHHTQSAQRIHRRPQFQPLPATPRTTRSTVRPSISATAAETRASDPRTSKKRLCIFSDGTWDEPSKDNDTHILALSRAIQHEDDGVQQIVFYDEGIGNEGGPAQQVISAAIGAGIDKNIIQLYSFLSLNYEDGDEIYLFGYSRGAYTVRSLAGLIYEAGLVRREHFDYVQEAYNMYRDRDVSADSDEARDFRNAHGDRVEINLMVCFDTVGALGVPYDHPSWLSFLPDPAERYRFHDTTVGEHVRHAVHAMSVDETRRAFKPTRMETRRGGAVKELFFAGGHAVMGGGDADVGQKKLAENSLKFMWDCWREWGLDLKVDEAIMPAEYVTDVAPKVKDFDVIQTVTGEYVRDIESVEVLHWSAVKCFQTVGWRPKALAHLEERILSWFVKE